AVAASLVVFKKIYNCNTGKTSGVLSVRVDFTLIFRSFLRPKQSKSECTLFLGKLHPIKDRLLWFVWGLLSVSRGVRSFVRSVEAVKKRVHVISRKHGYTIKERLPFRGKTTVEGDVVSRVFGVARRIHNIAQQVVP
ncbi:unnamed protein product, partial [Ectocarpus sp. 12 AP-2014]